MKTCILGYMLLDFEMSVCDKLQIMNSMDQPSLNIHISVTQNYALNKIIQKYINKQTIPTVLSVTG